MYAGGIAPSLELYLSRKNKTDLRQKQGVTKGAQPLTIYD